MGIVSSEVHQDSFISGISFGVFDEEDHGCQGEEDQSERIISTFHINSPIDQELLPSVNVEHFTSSTVELVGLQLWRGAFLLADFIFSHTDEFEDRTVLEVAAGTGITSIIAGSVAKEVHCTDIDQGEILPLIRRNFERNACHLRCENYSVWELDFFKEDWRDRMPITSNNPIILAADVVYNKDITREFFRSIEHLVNVFNETTIYIAVEQRKSVGDDGVLVHENFSYFLEKLEDLRTMEVCTSFEKIPLDFHQFLLEYDRVTELNLWKLKFQKRKHFAKGLEQTHRCL